nr:hypothetical protein [Halogeometricum sp. S1BR25-6]
MSAILPGPVFVDEVDGVRLFTHVDGVEVVERAVALANDLGDGSPLIVGCPAETVAWLEVELFRTSAGIVTE